MAASTASTCLRSDGDSVHSQKRDQASGRESSNGHGWYPSPASGAARRPLHPSARPLMEKFVIEGGVPLSGTVVPAGNKNAALPLLAACLLTAEPVVLHNVPRIRDTEAMLVLLEALGVKVERRDGNTIAPAGRRRSARPRSTPTWPSASAPRSWSAGRCSRASARRCCRRPGGDVIGRRRLDPHLDAFRALGAHVELDRDIRLTAPDGGLQACDFFMDEPSVMGTENALMAAALTPGSTIIRNAASEPHVQDLARMLTRMGAAIEGIGSNVMHVHGLDKLGGCEHAVSPDHIEIGSFMALAGVTGGELRIKDIVPDDLRMIRLAFSRLGPALGARRRRRRRPRRAEARRRARRRRLPDQGRGRPVAGVPGRPHLDRRGARHAGRGLGADLREDVREPPVLRRQADLDGRGDHALRPAPRDRDRPAPAARPARLLARHPRGHGDADRRAVRRRARPRSTTSARSTAATSASTSACARSARASSARSPSRLRSACPRSTRPPAGRATSCPTRCARCTRSSRRCAGCSTRAATARSTRRRSSTRRC